MKSATTCLVLVVLAAIVCLSEGVDKLQIGVKKRPEECPTRTKKGDKLSMHYTVRRAVLEPSLQFTMLSPSTPRAR